MNSIPLLALCALAAGAHGVAGAAGNAASHIALSGPWQVCVTPGSFNVGDVRVKIASKSTFDIVAPGVVQVTDERHAQLPVWTAGRAWSSGDRLTKLIANECTKPSLLIPESVVVKTAAGTGAALKLGADYRVEGQWASVGRVDGGALAAGQPVWIDYQYGVSRIDSIVVDKSGKSSLISGVPAVVSPQPPATPPGMVNVANVWIPGRIAALTPDNLYPIVEPKYPELISAHPVAEKLLPKTWAKLTSGQPLSILTWGDSITEGGAASDVAHRFQNRFATMLQAKFPNAKVTMTSLGWGGRAGRDFLNAPSGSRFNFEEKVVAPHPDLIVMEFINDGWMGADSALMEKAYNSLNDEFTKNGIEWLLVIPHYNYHTWMGNPTDRVETDSRPFVANLRAYVARHNMPFADWSVRWGHLAKEGIPFETLLLNGVNHPNDRAHQMLADSLLEIFGGPAK